MERQERVAPEDKASLPPLLREASLTSANTRAMKAAARLTDAGLLFQQFFQQFVPLRGEWIHYRHAIPGKSFLHIFR